MEAKERALELLLSKFGKEFDWNNLSNERDEIKFLQMVLADRLTLEAKSFEDKYMRPRWNLFAKAPGSTTPFVAKLPVRLDIIDFADISRSSNNLSHRQGKDSTQQLL